MTSSVNRLSSPLSSRGYEGNLTVKCLAAGSLKTIRGGICVVWGSMGEQQRQQQLRDAMRTFGVVFFYGPTVRQSTLHTHIASNVPGHRVGNITVTI